MFSTLALHFKEADLIITSIFRETSTCYNQFESIICLKYGPGYDVQKNNILNTHSLHAYLSNPHILFYKDDILYDPRVLFKLGHA